MTTMKDPSHTAYPNREQMLALIRARVTADAEGRGHPLCSAASESQSSTCISVLSS